MPQLEISLLGPLQVQLAGQLVTHFKTVKVQALLAYLMVENEHPHIREALATLLWPEQSESAARRNLRQSLHRMRQFIPAPYIHTTRNSIQIQPGEDYSLDVASFAHLISSYRTHDHPDLVTCQSCLNLLQQAVSLYQGDFLQNFYLADSAAFEEWALLKREWLRREALLALFHLTTHFEDQGDYGLARRYARRQIEIDPLREEGYRQLMRTLALSGRRSEALVQYESCRRLLANELGAEPASATTLLYERIRDGSVTSTTTDQPLKPVAAAVVSDRIEIPSIGNFYGRQDELNCLKQWLVEDRCRLVSILGMGGQGKTTLAAKFIHSLLESPVDPPINTEESLPKAGATEPGYDRIIWQSLLNAPTLDTVLQRLVQLLSAHGLSKLPDKLDTQLELLLDQLRQQRCLIIFDNIETILQGDDRVGHYRPGYEAYGQLFEMVGVREHQSGLLLTGRERPRGFARLERDTPLVRSFQLAGLPAAAGGEILHLHGLAGPDDTVASLVESYSGNPLALNLVAETIQDLFNGDMRLFLAEEIPIFDDIRDVLDQQFARLAAIEYDILIWLAIEREPASSQHLWENLIHRQSKRAFVEALRSLQRRSLLEHDDSGANSGFVLQNVVLEYVTERFVEAVVKELYSFSNPSDFTHTSSPVAERRDLRGDRSVSDSQQGSALFHGQPALSSSVKSLYHFNRFALLKGQAEDYVRESQHRLILQRIVERLVRQLGKSAVETTLRQILSTMRSFSSPTLGYVGGNVLNLLAHLGTDLRGFDLSRLTIWQAYLQDMALPEVNFAHSDLTGSVFTDTFGSIISIAISPDGQILAAGTYDGEIRLWELAGNRPYAIFKGHTSPVWSVSFSSDGQTLASGSGDQTICLWDIRSVTVLGNTVALPNFQPQHILAGHTNWVWVTTFSPDGRLLASGSSDETIRLWDTESGQLLKTLTVKSNGGVALSPDGQTIAGSTTEQVIHRWNVADLLTTSDLDLPESIQPRCTLHGHTNWVGTIAFSPDSQTLVSGSYDETVCLWDTQTGLCRHTMRGHTNRVVSVAFNADGETVASSSGDQTIRIWDTKTGLLRHVLSGHSNMVDCITFSPDSLTLASGSYDQSIRLWDVYTGQCRRTLRGHTQWIVAVAFSPDGRTLASGGYDQTVRLWDVITQTKLLNLNQESVALQPNQILPGHSSWIWSLAFSPDGRTLASASYDQTIRLWDTHTGLLRHVMLGHSNWVMSVAFSPDGQILASGSLDQTIRLWDVDTGQTRRILPDQPSLVWSIAFSSDGKTLASGGYDQIVHLWDIATGQLRRSMPGHDNIIWSVEFSPDGQSLVSGSLDQTARVWDVQTGQCRLVLSGHTNQISSVAFSPDGKMVATASYDRTVRLWDVANAHAVVANAHAVETNAHAVEANAEARVTNDHTLETGQTLHILQGHTNAVESVAFSPDGKILASSSGDETIKLWDVQNGECLQTVHADGPYAGLNITGATGLTEVQKAALKALGAIELNQPARIRR